MDLSSSLAGTKEFRIVKRGYDPDEVDAFLDQIALGVAELKRKAAEAREQAAASAAGGAEPQAPTASPSTSAEAEEIQRALILAQRTADEEVRKAEAEGEALVAEAREQAAGLLRRAEQEVAEERERGRAEVLAEVAALEARRDGLAADVTVLERHVEEQREVVQAALGELQSLLDHPEAFRVAPADQVADLPPAAVAASPAPAPPPATAETVDAAGDDDEEGDTAAEPDGPAAPEPQVRVDPPLAPLYDAEEEADADLPAPVISAPAVSDPGPPTEALDATQLEVDGEGDEDAFLAELRKAMLDDEPLGPRDEALLPAEGPDEGLVRAPRARFGRRR